MRTGVGMGRWALLAAMLVAGVLAVLVPLATGANGPSPSPSPVPQGCQLRTPQPEAPLQLNVVAAKGLAKTIALEKEVFNCFDAKSTLAQVKVVDTVIELTERAKGGGSSANAVTVGKSIEADACVKDLQAGRVSCRSQAVPLGATGTPLAGCQVTRSSYPFDTIQQPTHPVEMGTVTLPGGLVKTVEVEKEVFDCKGEIGDVYLFTEMLEQSRHEQFRQLWTHFDGVVCFKDEATAQLTGCKLFTPARSA